MIFLGSLIVYVKIKEKIFELPKSSLNQVVMKLCRSIDVCIEYKTLCCILVILIWYIFCHYEIKVGQ